MTPLDVFIISFGVAFIVQNDRARQWLHRLLGIEAG